MKITKLDRVFKLYNLLYLLNAAPALPQCPFTQSLVKKVEKQRDATAATLGYEHGICKRKKKLAVLVKMLWITIWHVTKQKRKKK